MPGNVDEKKWKRAKKISRKQIGRISWPLVMHIYQNMQKTKDEINKLSNNNFNMVKKSITDIKDKIELLRKIAKNPSWSPKREYLPEEHEKMKPLLDQGFSMKEASFIHGLENKENYTKGVEPISSGMLEHAKRVAGSHISDFKKQKIQEAEAEKNPELTTAKHIENLYQEVVHPVYKNMFQALSNSDEFKGMSTSEKIKEIKNLKNNFNNNNATSIEEHNSNMQNKIKDIGGDIKQKREKALNEQRQALVYGDKNNG